ncbi:MAG: hypothetical protein NTX01_05785 [Candidatus Omnitrophica bacterium]|nr:hypothetical protein [Candidatus Omnitrophota bacterium]
MKEAKPNKGIILGGLVLFFCLGAKVALAAVPILGTITPSSGSSAPDTAKAFTCVYSDVSGWTHLKEACFLININSTTLTNTVYLYYDQNTNKLYLRNDANSAWLGGYIPGSGNIVENSQVKLNCKSSTISGSANTLTVNWNITFKATYSGKAYNSYLYAKDDSGSVVTWTKKGDWTVNRSPALGTITPSSGIGQVNTAQSFTATYSDPDSWQNLQYAYLLINTSTDGTNCFYAYYDQNTNKLYLKNDANSAWLGGFAPGSSSIIENSYAKLNCVSTTISGSTNTLTVNWSITFKPPFIGIKKTYLSATDDVNALVSLTQQGTWIIVAQTLSISVNPKLWSIGSVAANSTVILSQANKITVTNDGSGPETFELKLINPPGWTASTTPGQEKYVLSGIFCNANELPQRNNFNQDISANEDVIATESKKATNTVFSYSQSTANGVAVPRSGVRSLYLQFKSPTITQRKEEQNISLIISCQIP